VFVSLLQIGRLAIAYRRELAVESDVTLLAIDEAVSNEA